MVKRRHLPGFHVSSSKSTGLKPGYLYPVVVESILPLSNITLRIFGAVKTTFLEASALISKLEVYRLQGQQTSGLEYPIGSMYGIFTYIYHKNQPNVGKYTIHGSYGI